jgi:hypothetical protein
MSIKLALKNLNKATKFLEQAKNHLLKNMKPVFKKDEPKRKYKKSKNN